MDTTILYAEIEKAINAAKENGILGKSQEEQKKWLDNYIAELKRKEGKKETPD